MISLNKKYTTRDGSKVTLISDNGRFPYHIVGYVGDSDVPTCWTRQGHYNMSVPGVGLDLVDVSDILIDIVIECSEKSSWVKSIEVHGTTLTAVTEHGTYTYYVDQLETAQLLMTDSYGQYINMLKRR